MGRSSSGEAAQEALETVEEELYEEALSTEEKVKPELELDDEDERGLESSTSQRPEGRLWSGHELEVFCRQNSSIPFVLAYLQVGLGPVNGYANGNGTAS